MSYDFSGPVFCYHRDFNSVQNAELPHNRFGLPSKDDHHHDPFDVLVLDTPRFGTASRTWWMDEERAPPRGKTMTLRSWRDERSTGGTHGRRGVLMKMDKRRPLKPLFIL